MLTADLAQSWQRGGRTGPRYIDPEDPKLLQEAGDLINLFKEHEGHPRHTLEERLQEYVGVGTDYRIMRGLIKLLMDRCSFETAVALDPAEIRRALFTKARRSHPLTADTSARTAIIDEVAQEFSCAPEVIRDGMYADLPENQKLSEFASISGRELLDLYNLAQAQALLYRSVEMQLWIEPQGTASYRELFGAIKAYRLIHTVKGSAAAGYEVRLDGPVSMFHRSQKYGIQMAVFLPALLLCEGWRMRAEISVKPWASGGSNSSGGASGGSAFFEMNSAQQQLRSHYLSATPYENPALEKLADKWGRSGSEWTLEASNEVLDLGDSAFIPDFVIRNAEGRKIYLEVLGFWTPRYLEARLKEFERGGLENFIIAAWDELRGSRDPLTRIPPHTIVFKRELDPAVVVAAINEMVSEGPIS